MNDLDLRSPLDLEIAESVTAAVARAMSGDLRLRYRGHLLCQGSTASPARAPHVHPDTETQDMGDLRGSADGTALRLLHSDLTIYRKHLPEEPFEELIYEMLEQFRVEALAPSAQRGTRANLQHRFSDWSDAFIAEGLLENDLGLLLFTVMHVCRSRTLAVPIAERANDHTEATRAGIYQVLGPNLLDLRPNIDRQEVFAGVAVAIAEAISELAASVSTTTTTGRIASTVLAMLRFESAESPDDLSILPPADGIQRQTASSAYQPFTAEFDSTIHVNELVLPHAQHETRAALDETLVEHQPLAAYLARTVLALFPAPIDSTWISEQEEGRIDPRLLTRIVTSPGDRHVFRRKTAINQPQAAVTFLIDCSGSMKANIPQVAALVDLFARALDRIDVATEILGFTTNTWNGGRAHRKWMATGRPAHPGRLNELCQIIFKDADTSWRRARSPISALLWTPMFREGIDGEALEWAYDRLLRRDVDQRCLILISDGSPMDGATSLTNGERYLDAHLTDVANRIESTGDVRLFGLGLGHDMSAYFRRSRIVDPQQVLSLEVTKTLVSFLSERPGSA